jgi:hypothetical protein
MEKHGFAALRLLTPGAERTAVMSITMARAVKDLRPMDSFRRMCTSYRVGVFRVEGKAITLGEEKYTTGNLEHQIFRPIKTQPKNFVNIQIPRPQVLFLCKLSAMLAKV